MVELSIGDLAIALVGGVVAGGMNALAGYGSIITLSILMEVMGLPPTIANATNRIGVLANGLGSSFGFYKGGKLQVQHGRWIIAITFVGAVVGIGAALVVSNAVFREVFKYLIIVLLVTIVVNPRRWLIEVSDPQSVSMWIAIPVFFVVGFYGGFIQMGMGLVFLAATVLIARYNLIDANALKVVAVSLYTTVGLLIFAYHDMLHWSYGLLLAVGQAIGGYAVAHSASKYPSANVWAYRLLIVIVFIILVRTIVTT